VAHSRPSAVRLVERGVLGVAFVEATRHCLMVLAHRRVRRHLASARSSAARGPLLVVVVPLVWEQDRIAEGVAHLRSVLDHVDGARLVLVTTERESSRSMSGPTTPSLAAALAASDDRMEHLHCPDSAARKGDQVNHAVDWASRAVADGDPANVVVAVYDIDSRPTTAAFAELVAMLEARPEVDVFHQSSRFEMRDRRGPIWSRVIADAGALRANRFVMSTELPRLLGRDPRAHAARRALAGLTYGHVTGHGLAMRTSHAATWPLPSRTEMEDMAYSFTLASRAVPVVALSSLDRADVPRSLREQFRQQSRWFRGPGRALQYRHDPAAGRGPPAAVVTASALLGVIDWLIAAFTIPIMWGAARSADRWRRVALRVLVGACLAELVSAERTLGASGRRWERVARVAAYPISNTMFGLAGWWSVPRVVRGER
jgi:hypothetical protein